MGLLSKKTADERVLTNLQSRLAMLQRDLVAAEGGEKHAETAQSAAYGNTGHKTLRVVADSLSRVIYYCVTNRLPILTVSDPATGSYRAGRLKIFPESAGN